MIPIEEFLFLVNSSNYSKRQMDYIYSPIEEVEKPTVKQLEKLLDKAESINDYKVYYQLIEKWGDWVLENLKDPFYSEKNINHLTKGAEALNNGEGVEHELIEDDD